MAIQFSPEEILETIRMVQMENLDIRTITMGISLRDCAHPDIERAAKKAYDKICRRPGGWSRWAMRSSTSTACRSSTSVSR